MRSIDLPIGLLASMKRTLSLEPFLFAPIKEPEVQGRGHRVEEIRAHGDHHVHGPFLDEPLTDLHFAALASEADWPQNPALPPPAQGTVELLYPQVVCVVRSGHSQQVAGIIFDPLLSIDVERGFAITKSNLFVLLWRLS